jgi:hypothetical protein
MTRSLWKFFTSLRLTVVCLAIGIVLVFLGTLAQRDDGLYLATGRWFRSWFVTWNHIPVFPGGYLVGVVLTLNLLSAHIKRFTWSPKKVGIQFTHLGIIALLFGQLATDMFSRETLMTLHDGETKNYTEAHRGNELIFATDVGDGKEEIVSIPDEIIAQKGTITAPKLPFVLRVQEYQPNSEVISHVSVKEAEGRLTTALATVEGEFSAPEGLVAQAERAAETEGRVNVWTAAFEAVGEHGVTDIVAAARKVAANHDQAVRLCTELKTRFRTEMLTRFGQANPAMRLAAERVTKKNGAVGDTLPTASTKGAGLEALALPIPVTNDDDKRNLTYANVDLVQAGQSMGTWLFTPWIDAQEITVGGKTYHVSFRFERDYHPFSLTLLKMTHEVYRGTDIPKNFQSRVHINNPQTGESRDVDIYMNNPLRYAGLTFYQYQMSPDEMRGNDKTTTLQVVRNPSWLTPYFGCSMVAFGMAYQFLFHLWGFIRKRSARAEVTESKSPRRSQSKRERAAVS